MKRIFAAIKISPSAEFIDIYSEIRKKLSIHKIKWVEQNNIHITLKFFGETPEKRIPDICNALKKAAVISSPFSLQIKNTGIFGSSYKPRVIWFGIEAGNEMKDLFNNISQQLLEIGIESDRQNFVPHLTIGRIKYLNDKRQFQETINEYRDIFIMEDHIKTFSLFESNLTPKGPIYTVLGSFDLLHNNT